MNSKHKLSLTLAMALSVTTVSGALAAGTGHGNAQAQGRPSARPEASHSPAPGKLVACQAKEKAIQKRSDQLAKRAKTMETTFDGIASRVEDYYAGVVQPAGHTVARYDSLVSTINTNRDAVNTAVKAAQSDAASFSCDQNPKVELTKFNTDMKVVITALNKYKTSVKNLIVAVRTANSTPSPHPTASPEGSRQ